MTEQLKTLPVRSVDEILESVYTGEKFGEPYDSVINAHFSPVGFINSQDRDDALTDLIYEKDEGGKVIYPSVSKKSKAEPYHAIIGEQTSKYHKETVSQHLLMVLGGVAEEVKNADIQDKNAVYVMAITHDAAKKYDSMTNKKGEVCFYDHEHLSAYFAAAIYKQLGYTKEQSRPYVQAIYDHMLPFNVWSKDTEAEKAYTEKYGQKQHNLVKLINRNDRGAHSKDEIKELESLMEKGYMTAVILESELGRERHAESRHGQSVTVMCGLPGGGKSTKAKELAEMTDGILISTDAIREELTGSPNDQSRNREVFDTAFKRLDKAIAEGRNVIWDATSISPKARKQVLLHVPHNWFRTCCYMDVSADICRARNKARYEQERAEGKEHPRYVPNEVIDRMAGHAGQPSSEEGFDEIISFDPEGKAHMIYDVSEKKERKSGKEAERKTNICHIPLSERIKEGKQQKNRQKDKKTATREDR